MSRWTAGQAYLSWHSAQRSMVRGAPWVATRVQRAAEVKKAWKVLKDLGRMK